MPGSDPVTAVANLITAILEPISKELSTRYTRKYTENMRAISEEIRHYPNHDAAKIEALKQDQVDIISSVRLEFESAKK